MRPAFSACVASLGLSLAGCLPEAVLLTPDTGGCGAPSSWYFDGDGDGHGDPNTVSLSCDAPQGYVSGADDCDDADDAIWEGVVVWPDDDGDGYGLDGWERLVCGAAGDGEATVAGDCDDGEATVYTGAPAICGDELDNNCDGATDCALPEGDLGPDASAATLTGGVEQRFALALATPGDLTGDAIADLLVGMTLSEEIPAVPGEVLLFPGPFEGSRDADDAIVFLGGVAGDLAGTALSGVGDLDEDGYTDALVGVTGGGSSGQGAVFPIFGPVTSAGNLADSGVSVVGVATRDRAGAAVASPGDVYGGDGLPEVLIGSPGVASKGGAVYLALGPITAGETGLADEGKAIRWAGTAREELGSSLAVVGDINGDGVIEALTGAPAHSGDLDGLGAAYAVSMDAPPGDVPDVALGWVTGPSEGATLGVSVASVGDVDGDGYEDLLMGSPEVSAPATETESAAARAGAIWLVGGADLAVATGGAMGSVVPALAWAYGPERDAELGVAVLGPGDIDEDGTPDLCGGAPGGGESGDGGGAVLCWYGYDLGELTPAGASFTFWGETPSARAGQVFIGAGDLNALAVPDLWIGAPGELGVADDPASVWLLMGDGF